MKNQQPKIKKGTSFIGWGLSNWGILYDEVYRTRKEAIAAGIGGGECGSTWKLASRNHRVFKVKVTVL